MAAAVGRLLPIDARRDHHVEPVFEESRDHGRRGRRVIGRIAVDQNVDVRVHVGEHAPHHVALALVRLPPHHGAGRARNLDGAVGRIVVIDVDRGLGQRGPEIRDHLGDGGFLVEAGHQNRDPVPDARPKVIRTHRDPLGFGHQFAPLVGPRFDRLSGANCRTCRLTIAFLFSRVLVYGSIPLAVIVPFESRSPSSIDCLVGLVTADMERVNAAILSRTGSQVAMIPEVANHLISSGGKRLRPMLTLAMAKLVGYAGEGHVKLAAAVEFMHTATLLHDDVVDESEMRRGKARRARCCGATRRACWSAISCSARHSR